MTAQKLTTTNGKITVTIKKRNKENRNPGFSEIDFSLNELPGNIIELSSAGRLSYSWYATDDITISGDYITTCASEPACDTPPIGIETKYQILPTDTIARIIKTHLWQLAYVWKNDKLMVTLKPLEGD